MLSISCIAEVTLSLECPTFEKKIAEVKSINLFPFMSKILKSFAESQSIGIWPCIDLDSYLSSLSKTCLVPSQGISVLINLCSVDIGTTFFGVLEN